MGLDANLIILGQDACERYESCNRGRTLDQDLFWGPHHALAYIRAQGPFDGWVEEIRASGGVVLDLERKHLLWFGGEISRERVALQRIHHELMTHIWAGWTIRHAFGDVGELADYIGLNRSLVLSEECEPRPLQFSAEKILKARREKWVSTLASFRVSESEIRCGQLPHSLQQLLPVYGEALALSEELQNWPTTLDLNWNTGPVVWQGFHADLPMRSLFYWSTESHSDFPRRIQQQWPGWQIISCENRFEAQLEQANGQIRIVQKARETMFDAMREWLGEREESHYCTSDCTLHIADTLSELERTLPVSEPLPEVHPSQPVSVRRRLLEYAIARSRLG